MARLRVRWGDRIKRNPLVWALPIQAAMLFWRLDLLEPWGDEWFTKIQLRGPGTLLTAFLRKGSGGVFL